MVLSVATALATDAPTPAESTVVQGSPTTPTLVPCDIECPEEDGYFEVEPCSPLFCNCADGIGYEQVIRIIDTSKVRMGCVIISFRSATTASSSTRSTWSARSRKTIRIAKFVFRTGNKWHLFSNSRCIVQCCCPRSSFRHPSDSGRCRPGCGRRRRMGSPGSSRRLGL